MDKHENYCNFVDFANSIAIGNIEIIGSIKIQVTLLQIKKEYLGAVEGRYRYFGEYYRKQILQKITNTGKNERIYQNVKNA